MPDSMYDKLGKLLNSALESGELFNSPKKENQTEDKQNYSDEETQSAKNEHNKQNNDSINQNEEKTSVPKINEKIFIDAPFYIKNEAKILCLTDDMNYKKAKQQFRKKINAFHPDKHSKSEITKKISLEKTSQILQAWKIAEEWFLS